VNPKRVNFALRVVPSCINVPAGATVPVTVHALRKDGFAGAIGLRLRDAPDGFVLHGGRVPPGQDTVQVTLTAPSTPLDDPLPFMLEGHAKIGEQVVRHLAVPAEDMMQAFLNRHLVPADDFLVAVTKKRRGTPPLRLIDTTPVRLRPGGKATVRLRGPRKPPVGKIELELLDGPAGVTLGELSPVGRETTFVLHADAETAVPGWQGNVLVEVFIVRPGKTKEGKPRGPARRTSLGVLPALRLVIARPK